MLFLPFFRWIIDQYRFSHSRISRKKIGKCEKLTIPLLVSKTAGHWIIFYRTENPKRKPRRKRWRSNFGSLFLVFLTQVQGAQKCIWIHANLDIILFFMILCLPFKTKFKHTNQQKLMIHCCNLGFSRQSKSFLLLFEFKISFSYILYVDNLIRQYWRI